MEIFQIDPTWIFWSGPPYRLKFDHSLDLVCDDYLFEEDEIFQTDLIIQ